MPNPVPDYADLVGKPFMWGGRGPEHYDCYGLLMEMFARAGKPIRQFSSTSDLIAIANMMESHGSTWVETACAPGVCVAFKMPVKQGDKWVRRITHVGFMVSNDRMIHTWEQSGGVVRERLDIWRPRIAGFYVPGEMA